MKKLITICLTCLPLLLPAQHPLTFFTPAEAAFVKNNFSRYVLSRESFSEIKKEVDLSLGKDIDVPVPKDPQGGYTHDRHKANYMLLFNAGLLYNLTGNAQYAGLAKTVLLKYARLNPTLKNHPQATGSSPGHLFWQALNDANWLVYAGMAYDLIYTSLPVSERKIIEDGAFKPEVDFITNDLRSWFDLIHNHGVWACAGVGIVGIATNNKEYVDRALYGSQKDGKSGFLAQLKGLFSPDGYYTEGPYYVRYAILPFYLFAVALDHARPELKIFNYRDKILRKALLAALQQTNLDGTFYAFNDALRGKDYTSNELVSAIDIAWDVYGADQTLLPVVQKQGRVLMNRGGILLAAASAEEKNIPEYYSYHPVEYKDGSNGEEGGISLMRMGKDEGLSTVLFKYTAHGLSHGHFDRLAYSLFDKGNEVLTDYGAVRFVGVEQKYGGRYLPENKSYATQTIAHNTVVVDEESQYKGQETEAEKTHPERRFSSLGSGAVQLVSATEDKAYKGVKLSRTVYFLDLPGTNRMIVDLFRINSDDPHQYDLPFHFTGTLIKTSFPYTAFTSKMETVGKKSGYQFLWKEASADLKDTLAQMTFLNERTFYSISSLIEGKGSCLLARTGANDPDFNLRHEPVFILRQNEKNGSFLNVVEIHGNYDPVSEFSTGSYPSVKRLRWIRNDSQYAIAEITVANKKLVVAECVNDTDKQSQHVSSALEWKGPFAVWYDAKIIH